jgi:photosystem II stability/assembly factor-like uncharacterized protein
LASTRSSLLYASDEQHFWLAFGSAGHVHVASTGDGGQTWNDHPGPALEAGPFSGTDSAPVAVSFADTAHGWAVVTSPGGNRFAPGKVHATADGGQTWSAPVSIPIASPVKFVTSMDGWTAPGPGNRNIYSSHDGGATWQPVTLPSLPPSTSTSLLLAGLTLPIFADTADGILPTMFSDTAQTGPNDTLEVYVTHDSGSTWIATTPLSFPGIGTLMESYLAMPDSSHWLFTAQGQLFVTNDAGLTWRTISPNFSALDPVTASPGEAVRYSLSQLSFPVPSAGWAILTSSHCTPAPKASITPCRTGTVLVKTQDGGQTWTAP